MGDHSTYWGVQIVTHILKQIVVFIVFFVFFFVFVVVIDFCRCYHHHQHPHPHHYHILKVSWVNSLGKGWGQTQRHTTITIYRLNETTWMSIKCIWLLCLVFTEDKLLCSPDCLIYHIRASNKTLLVNHIQLSWS